MTSSIFPQRKRGLDFLRNVTAALLDTTVDVFTFIGILWERGIGHDAKFSVGTYVDRDRDRKLHKGGLCEKLLTL